LEKGKPELDWPDYQQQTAAPAIPKRHLTLLSRSATVYGSHPGMASFAIRIPLKQHRLPPDNCFSSNNQHDANIPQPHHHEG